MNMAAAIADRWVRRDRRHAVHDARYEEAVSIAALAVVGGDDPDEAVMAYLKAERSWAWWNRTGDPDRSLEKATA